LQPKTLPHWQSGVRIETCPARQLTGEHECAEDYYSEHSLLRTPVEDLQRKNAFTLTIRALSVIAYLRQASLRFSRRSLPSPDLNDGKQKYRIDERVCAHELREHLLCFAAGIEPFLLTGEKTGG